MGYGSLELQRRSTNMIERERPLAPRQADNFAAGGIDTEVTQMDRAPDYQPHLLEALEPGEELRVQALATDALLAVTDRRLVVAAAKRVALAVAFEDLRRIQFDIERDRPATLVIVPEMAHHEPQVLSIPPERYREASEVLVLIGQQLARPNRAGTG
jgi:hypothetical protein